MHAIFFRMYFYVFFEAVISSVFIFRDATLRDPMMSGGRT